MCYHDQKLYVTYCSPGKVETLDLDGNGVWYIDSFHQPNLFHVTVFNDNDKTNICVSDNSTHRITILNLFKTLDWRLHTLHGNNPRGIVTLCSGVIGVCSVTSSEFYIISRVRGNHWSYKKFKCVKSPLSVAYCDDTGTLYLSSGDSKQGNYIHTYVVTK